MQPDTRPEFSKKTTAADERMQRILDEIHKRFREQISLSALADEIYVSPSTLSRMFVKETGLHFADYVRKLRLDYAAGQLAAAGQSITKIAVDSGFTNLSGFNRAFREEYKISPTEYRRQMQREAPPALPEDLPGAAAGAGVQPQALTVEADAGNGSEYKKIWQECVNIGPAFALLEASMQAHVRCLAKELGFHYARFWNIFSEQMKVTDGIHTGNQNFDKLDSIFDFLLEAEIRPYIDLGALRPDTAVIARMDVVYYEEEDVFFRSRNAWEETVRAFLLHITGRYGQEEVSHWIFENGYDPNHKKPCYQDPSYDYFESYRYLYRQVRSLVPGAQIGGPLAINGDDTGFLAQFLGDCVREHCIPDFVSVILFPYTAEKKSGTITRTRDLSRDFEARELSRVRGIMKECGVSAKLYAAEWNSTLSSRNFLNDSCCRGIYLIRRAMQMTPYADLAGVWVASDWVSSYYDVQGIANGGNGLITKNSICKPAFFALQFLNSLGSRLLAVKDNCIVTAAGPAEFYILCTGGADPVSEKNLSEELFSAPEQLKELLSGKNSSAPSSSGSFAPSGSGHDLLPGQPPLTLKLLLNHVPDGRYIVKRRSVSHAEGSLLGEWEKFAFDRNLSSDDTEYIRRVCFPRMGMKKEEAKAGSLRIEETLRQFEIVLLHIYPDKNR